MTVKQLVDAIPTTFKVLQLSNRCEVLCKQCSFKETIEKQYLKLWKWDDRNQISLSERTERHGIWHETNPDKSWEEEQHTRLTNATSLVMKELNRFFFGV